jgi:hypothetical protein
MSLTAITFLLSIALASSADNTLYLTFGHRCCNMSKARACSAARHHGYDCQSHDMSSLDPSFRRRHAKTLETPRGGGLWLWKPYLINKTLHEHHDSEDFLLIYADAGIYLNAPVTQDIISLLDNETLGALTFGVGLPQYQYCKRDAFVRQRCDTDECHNAMQVNGAFSLWRPRGRKLAHAWLSDCLDHAALSDDPSTLDHELPGFVTHRHDQALLTNVLTRDNWPRDTTHGHYTHMFVHDRDKS